MKSIKEMSRSLGIAILLVVYTTIGVLHEQLTTRSLSKYAVAAESEDFMCYMQTSDGRVINLSKWCGRKDKPIISTISKADQEFLQRYQGFLEKRANGSPVVRDLISQALQDPQAVIQRARSVCTAMRNGQAQLTSEQVADDLFQTMAPKYYCPEMND